MHPSTPNVQLAESPSQALSPGCFGQSENAVEALRAPAQSVHLDINGKGYTLLNAIALAPSALAGRNELRNLVRCATVVRWSGGEWRQRATPPRCLRRKRSASIRADGTANVRSSSQDLGTGTYTVMTQIAADAFGMAVSKVIFELGDTGLPEAPASGGSQTVASVGPALYAAATAARDRLVHIAVGDPLSSLHGMSANDVVADDGWLIDRNRAGRPVRVDDRCAWAPRWFAIHSITGRYANRTGHPPPMPSITLPVPPHIGHGFPLMVPVPLQLSHTASPVPGVSGTAWSPGFGGVVVAIMPPEIDDFARQAMKVI